MPNRILKETITTSDSIDQLSWFEECFFYRLMVSCDDFGRMDGRPAILRSRLFPLKSVSDKQILDAICSLCSSGIITSYTVDGKPYIMLNTWDKHQQIRAKKSKYPQMIANDINCNQMISDDSKCPRNPIQYESNPNPNIYMSTQRKRFVAPTIDEVKAYCSERKNNVNAERFVDFYASKGWRVGNAPMKDWKASVRTWEKNDTKNDRQKTVSAQSYGQRDYTADEYASLDFDVAKELGL